MGFSSLLDAVHLFLSENKPLSEDEAQDAMTLILRGEASAVELTAFLVALRTRGETAQELTGFAKAMRAAATPLDIPSPLLDTCGTGGNRVSTFNISTTAAFVLAGAGVRVAKHGNRAISSKCGSSDLLEQLGVDITSPGKSVAEHGIGFLFAPAFHPAMRHVQPLRRELKLRTVFNMLGPLTNPARANTQIVGVFSVQAASLMAEALTALGLERGFVFHGLGGLGEVSTAGTTAFFKIEHGTVEESTWEPEDFGIVRVRPEDLAGGGAEMNARIARAVLSGQKGPLRDIVLVNAAVGLVASGKSADIRDGMLRAKESIDSGAAQNKLAAMSSGNF